MNTSLISFDPDEPRTDQGDPRASLLAQLVGPDPDGRRQALRTARDRRWVDSYGEVIVRAILVDGGTVARRNFVRALSVSGRGHTLVLDGDHEIVLVTSTHRTELNIDEWVGTAVSATASRSSARPGRPLSTSKSKICTAPRPTPEPPPNSSRSRAVTRLERLVQKTLECGGSCTA